MENNDYITREGSYYFDLKHMYLNINSYQRVPGSRW